MKYDRNLKHGLDVILIKNQVLSGLGTRARFPGLDFQFIDAQQQRVSNKFLILK